VAVDPLTNKSYVANSDSNSVTVIDGATNSTTTVTSGTNPTAVAVNPDTNRVYVSNAGSGNVTVIDGTNNSTATVAAGTGPQAVAVNSVTNRIYAANYGSNNVTVIDWANKSLTLTFSGTGGGIVTGSGKRNGIPVSFSTNTGVTQYFDIGTTVNLHGEQGEYSIFTGWSEACSGTSDCALPMTDNRDVAAVFDFYTAHKTWIEGTETYKPTLLEAYTAAEPNDIILAWGTDFNGETLILDKNIAVTLKGGYNREYTNDNGGFTTLQGSLTVKSGLLTVEQLIIR
jgi:YVTN family beta-propeller protein